MIPIRVKYTGDESWSEKWIEELTQLQENLNQLLTEAEEKGNLLKINSNMEIVLI